MDNTRENIVEEQGHGSGARSDFEQYGGYFGPDMASFRSIRAYDTCRNIRRLCGARNSGRVLEVGCGDGAVLDGLSASWRGAGLYGLDVSHTGLEAARARQIPGLVELRHFDGYAIPFPDKYFDVVLLPLVLEYVDEPRRLLRECARVGRLVYVQVQLYDVASRRDFVPDQFHTLNWYCGRSFRLQLQSSGLKILQFRTHNPVVGTYTLASRSRIRGWAKWATKEAGLWLFPWIAKRLWNYQCSALCEGSGANV